MQVIFTIIIFCIAEWWLQKKCIYLSQVPFILVLLGYLLLCPFSNILRYELNDVTSVRTIGIHEYTASVVWWCGSATLAIISYLFPWRKNDGGKIKGILNIEDDMFKRLNGIINTQYIFLLIILIGMYFLNPFAGIDFGVLAPNKESDLAVGGLLIGGIILITFSSISLPLVLSRPFLGWAAVIISLLGMLGTGSKGIAGVYLLFICFYYYKYNKYSHGLSRYRLISVMVFLISFAFYQF